MFSRRSDPILLTEEGIEALCASLNRPVVDAGGVPVGPARSVIALHRDVSGRPALVVALRSEPSGVVTVFEFKGRTRTAAEALDAALGFAEGMGFLFDDDMLASGAADSQRRAFECWCNLTGDDPSPVQPPAPQPASDSLELHDLMDEIDDDLVEDLAQDLAADLDAGLGPELDLGEELDVVPEAAVLSKFRVQRPETTEEAPTTPAVADEDGGGAQLGRIPILRRRRTAEEGAPVPLLTRLLARF